MTDALGREIDYLRVSITDRCNLRCRYCMPNGAEWMPMEEILTYEEIAKVCEAGAALGIRHVKVTGGEPLVRKNCADLVAMIGEIPGIEAVTLTTNGILLKEQLPDLVRAGLRAVNISLDTLNREKYASLTGFDALEGVMDGIAAALSAGLRVKINAVSLDLGADDAEDPEWFALASLAKDLPLDVRFIEVMPIGFGRTFQTIDHRTLLASLKERVPQLKEDQSAHGFGPARYVRAEGWKGSIGFISAIHGKFCAECNRVRLTSTGLLKPCLCYEDGVNLRDILRGKMDADLRDVMQKAIFKKPAAHCFEMPGQITEQQGMSQIGG